MEKNKKSGISVVLYILSFILASYFIYSAIICTDIVIGEINDAKIKLFDDLYNIANYYMQYSIIYLVYAAVCFALGSLCGRTGGVVPAAAPVNTGIEGAEKIVETVKSGDAEGTADKSSD